MRILKKLVFIHPYTISLVFLLGEKYTITRALHSAFLIVVESFSHSSNHVDLPFYIARAQRGVVLLENSGMKYALKFAIPKNDLTSAMVIGLVALSKAVVQSWMGVTLFAEKITPKNSIFGTSKMQFF